MKLVVAVAGLTIASAESLGAQSAKLPDLPLKRIPTPTTAEITARDVMTRTYIIADDSMEGRDTGKRGGLKSATYIAEELKRLGLEPAGDNGTYFQAIPWINRAPDTTSVLSVGETPLKWRTDFIVLPKLGFALALGGQPFGGGFDAATFRRSMVAGSAIRRLPQPMRAARSSSSRLQRRIRASTSF